MAHIITEEITIVISRIARDNEDVAKLSDSCPELITTLETVAQELVGKDAIVEIK